MQGEKPDLPEFDSTASGAKVVGAYDDVDGTSAFVLTDITQDDAWVAVPITRTLDLDEWR